MGNTLEHLYKPVGASLGAKPRKIPIVLQNQHAIANGFVTLGPRRSEFYTMPPQNYNFVGTNDWLNMLAVHEFRHVVQYEKSRTGFTKFVGYLLGDYSRNATASGSVPSWFWEGDAVGTETALTHSGRGRFPDFNMAFRASLLEKGKFNYSKQYLRSFKDFIPNHYVLGYHFSTYIKNKYGAKQQEQLIKDTWNLPFIPFRYSFAMQKATQQKMPALYNQMMDELKHQWEQQIASEELTGFDKVPVAEPRHFTGYRYPQPVDGGEVLAFKSGLDDIPQLVLLNPETGNETKAITLGPINNPGFLSVAGNTAVWTEYRYNPRWLTQSYSVVMKGNLVTKKATQLTSKTRYAAAAISPDRSKIVVVETPTDYTNRLVILNAYTGEVMQTIANQEGAFYSMPRWNNTGTGIVVLNQKNQQKAILAIQLSTLQQQVVLPYSYEHIGHPVWYNSFVFYNSGYSGIDNIYAINLRTAQRFRVTSSRYGAANPVVSMEGNQLIYNDYTVEGYRVVTIPFAPDTWQPLSAVKVTDIGWYKPLVAAENNQDVLLHVPDSVYRVSRYHKKPLNIHSWGPLFNGSLTDIEAGVYSQNILSTTDVFAGAQFDNMGNVKGLARVSYQGLYPIIDVTASYGYRTTNRITSYIENDTSIVTLEEQNVTWNETTLKGGVRFPWLLTKSRFNAKVEVHNYVGLTQVANLTSTVQDKNIIYTNLVNNGTLLQNEFVFTWYNLLNQAKRDIYSKWGQSFVFENYATPFGGDFKGGLTAIKGQLYFPGFFRHHSINFFGGYQHQKFTLSNNEYFFNNRMPYPRGVSGQTFENFFTLRANYALPLLHPDLRIGPFVYIQRIKANLFYDYGYGSTNVSRRVGSLDLSLQSDKAYYSTGVELTFDFNVMRALPLLEMGVRASYQPDTGTSNVELLIGSLGF